MKMGISGKSMKAINQFIDGVDLKWIFVRDCESVAQPRRNKKVIVWTDVMPV